LRNKYVNAWKKTGVQTDNQLCQRLRKTKGKEDRGGRNKRIK
jgi:hypothetical protein